MKKIHLDLFIVLFLLMGQISGCAYENYNRASYAPAYGMEARVSFFYDSLQPHGRWFQHNRYGWVWYPYNVSVDWRPYTDGYWVLTDYGWTWVSSQPWGWACFHYGRWFFDSAYGWCWYPDTVWAPAWVLWRTGGDWIGWAPLPPEAEWRVSVGLVFSNYEADRHVPSFGYCFARRNEFFEPDLHHRIVLHARNVTLIRQTNITVNNIRIVNNRVVNEFPDEGRFENEFRDRVRRYRVTEAESPGPARVQGEEVMVYRPERGRQLTAAPIPEGRQPAMEQRREIQQPAGERVSPSQKPFIEHERRAPNQQPAMEERREIQQPVIERQEQGGNRGEERSTVPVVRQQRVRPTPELKSQQESEARALEQEQAVRKNKLEETHSQELATRQQVVKPEEIKKEQQAELKAFQEQSDRERQLLRESQQEEATTEGTEQRPAKKHFKIHRDRGEQDSNEEK